MEEHKRWDGRTDLAARRRGRFGDDDDNNDDHNNKEEQTPSDATAASLGVASVGRHASHCRDRPSPHSLSPSRATEVFSCCSPSEREREDY